MMTSRCSAPLSWIGAEMWKATLAIGVAIFVVGLALAAYADEVSSWRARVYGEPDRPARFFAARGFTLAVIGAVVAATSLLHP
jgi:hypothetical protein